MSPRRHAGPGHLALLLLLGLGLLAAPSPARAAACCVSATSFGVGRLRIWEQAAVGLSPGASLGQGFFDHLGTWHPYADYGDDSLRASLWGLYRLSERGQLFASGSGVITFRHTASVREVGGGPGDLLLGYRHELLEIGEFLGWPGIALTASASLPTGRAPHASRTVFASDVTSRGGASLAAAVSVEKTRLPFFGVLDLGMLLPLPFRAGEDGPWQRYGPRGDLGLTFGMEALAEVLVVALSARASLEAALHRGGIRIENSGTHLLSVAASLSWLIDNRWSLTASCETALFANRLGDNLPAGVIPALSLRRGFF